MHTVIKYKNNEKALHKNSKGYILICFQYQRIVAANFVINLSWQGLLEVILSNTLLKTMRFLS